ncbi:MULTISPECIES: rhodanese-like domain-containing protein [unclassified Marinobacter]|uniref:rhodanese-like domain-containing protein n=1 Tax=unclassified Marinobacter TaxID=83889 RepID=UPI0026E1F5C1|nr:MULTISPECIES: rhodanese-like domain-containing protein [unclassified Marinobacter]MDO6441807.1 rhodanese-like domain-containing protein [Marinobacter sp. 2_MG-2023]MDO6824808.1 rhodanese-like domain-containing protein [Marinobacter sp. 1_MG-2023]
MRLLLAALLITFGLSFQASAKDALSLTPQETYDLVQKQGDQVLFVDVRDPVEIMFIGYTDVVDINIPFMLADRSTFLADKGRFAMETNPNFAASVEQALKDKGLGKDALIITMCRSGSSRGKPSADYLLEHGFTNVKYIDHGFQGSGAKEGKKAGMRIVNGWQNEGLPWSMKLNPEKIFQP